MLRCADLISLGCKSEVSCWNCDINVQRSEDATFHASYLLDSKLYSASVNYFWVRCFCEKHDWVTREKGGKAMAYSEYVASHAWFRCRYRHYSAVLHSINRFSPIFGKKAPKKYFAVFFQVCRFFDWSYLYATQMNIQKDDWHWFCGFYRGCGSPRRCLLP